MVEVISDYMASELQDTETGLVSHLVFLFSLLPSFCQYQILLGSIIVLITRFN